MSTLNDINKVDNVTSVLAAHVNDLIASTLRSEYTNIETLSATRTLLAVDMPIQRFDCNGANRDVKVPTANTTTNHLYFIVNATASGSYVITLKSNDGATTYATVAVGQAVLAVPDGNGGYKIVGSNATDGWTAVTETWTYASASTITIPSDGTTKYQPGIKVRFKQGGGWKYYMGRTVAATLLTVFVNTDFTVANAAITDISYSYEENPYGWPEYFNYSSSPSGVTLGNGTLVSKMKAYGKTMETEILLTLGSTSSISGLVTFSAPVAEIAVGLYLCWLQDSGTNTYEGLALLSGGSIYVYANNTGSSYGSVSSTSSTVPYTWATGDYISIRLKYRWL